MYQTTEQILEKDILNYSSTVMFRGTPCTINFSNRHQYAEPETVYKRAPYNYVIKKLNIFRISLPVSQEYNIL